MGVPIKRVMCSNDDGTEEQIFPQTHVNAVLGLLEAVKGYDIEIGVKSINGMTGNIFLNILDDDEYNKILEVIKKHNEDVLELAIEKNKDDIIELKTKVEELEKLVEELSKNEIKK